MAALSAKSAVSSTPPRTSVTQSKRSLRSRSTPACSVVALMQRAMRDPVHTFCLAFEEASWGEQEYAALIQASYRRYGEVAKAADVKAD